MDIFPLDQVPVNTGRKYDLHVRLISLLKQASLNRGLIISPKTWRGKLFHILLSPISYDWLKKCTKRLMAAWNKKKAKYYVCWNYIYSIPKETFPIEWFGIGTKVSYGGKLYCVPERWDSVLTQIYGDYMTLPPEDKRINHGPIEVRL